MSLKQIGSAKRIDFLREFVTELIVNSEEPKLAEKKIKKQIELGKLKKKFLKPIDEEKNFHPSFFQKPVYSVQSEIGLNSGEKNKMNLNFGKRKQIIHRIGIPKSRRMQQQVVQPKPIQNLSVKRKAIVEPEAKPRPEGFNLGKLEFLFKDASVQSIECSGPGKNILVKKYNKVNVTKIVLNQAEITDIINNFAENARIPITGGILKAAVGDFVISAVISEFVGSRFIINKITPYSIIQK